jgi:hypothetical protein
MQPVVIDLDVDALTWHELAALILVARRYVARDPGAVTWTTTLALRRRGFPTAWSGPMQRALSSACERGLIYTSLTSSRANLSADGEQALGRYLAVYQQDAVAVAAVAGTPVWEWQR